MERVTSGNETYCWYSDLNRYSWCPSEVRVLEIVPLALLVFLCFMFGFITITAIYGNGLVVYVVATTNNLHNTTYYLLANLAVSDILIAVVCIPFQFYAALIQRWDLPSFMCKLCPFTQIFSVNVSIFTQVAIALDRYQGITQPLSNQVSNMNAKRTKKRIFVIIWIVALVLASPVPGFFKIRHVQDGHYKGLKPYCSSLSNEDAYAKGIIPVQSNVTFQNQWISYETYVNITFFYQYLIPVTLVSIMYAHMCIHIWQRSTPGVQLDEQTLYLLNQKKKTIRMMVVVLLAFVLCWLPWQIFHVAAHFFPNMAQWTHAQPVFLACQWLAMSNSSCNPFIYTLLSDNVKKLTQALYCAPQNCFKWFGESEMDDQDESTAMQLQEIENVQQVLENV